MRLHKLCTCCVVFSIIFIFSQQDPAFGLDAPSAPSAPSAADPSCHSTSECLEDKCTTTQRDGTKNPLSTTNCVGGMCGICDVLTDTTIAWANPQAEIVVVPGVYGGGLKSLVSTLLQRKTIDSRRCKTADWARFCARPAKAGTYGNGSTNPKLCVYEDPMDPADTDSGSGKYHERSQSAGGLIGALIDRNLLVYKTVGCVSMHISPLPPPWNHSLWLDLSEPTPTFIEDTTRSVFEAPVIEVRRCKDAATGELVSCGEPNSITVVPSEYLAPQLSNDYKDCINSNGMHITNPTIANTPAPMRAFCAEITKQNPEKVVINMLAQDQWTRALASIERPGYMPKPTLVASYTSTSASPQIDVTLRGQTITLEDDPGLHPTAPALPAPSATWDPEKSRGYLHQVEFRVDRPCEAGKLEINQQVIGGITVETKTCKQYKNMVCVYGYEKAPLSVVKKVSTPATTQDDVPLASLPNVLKARNVAFANINANEELGAPLQETFSRNAWIRDPDMPDTCYRRNEDVNSPYCQNYSGACVDGDAGGVGACDEYAIENTSVTADAWYVNPAVNTVRPMNAFESGLCIATPPDLTRYAYETPGSYTTNDAAYTYTVPQNCAEVTVTLWGAGGVGRDYDGDNGRSGGSAAYSEAVFAVQSGDVVKMVIGLGGQSLGASGGQSEAILKRNNNTLGWIRAGGGNVDQGGSGSYSGGTSIIDFSTQTGLTGNATRSVDSLAAGDNGNGGAWGVAGANVWLGTSWGNGQPGGECATWTGGGERGTYTAPFGGGGCFVERYRAPGGYDRDDSWGKGGPGRALVQCTAGGLE